MSAVQDVQATYERLVAEAQTANQHSRELEAEVKSLANQLYTMTNDENYDRQVYIALEDRLEAAETQAHNALRDASRKSMEALRARHTLEEAKKA